MSYRIGMPDITIRSTRLVTAISVLAATFVGLGFMLAIGANWDFVTAVTKLVAIVTVTVISYLSGWILKSKPTKSPLGDAFIFLGVMLYGVSIWLIAQVYGYEIEFHTGSLLWALGCIPIAILARSSVIALLITSLLNYWLLSESYSISNLIVWAILSFGVVYYVRSPWALGKALIGGAIWIAEKAHLDLYGLGYYGLILCFIYLSQTTLASSIWTRMSKPYFYLGSLLTLIPLLLLTTKYSKCLMPDDPQWSVFAGLQILLVVSFLVSVFNRSKEWPQILGCSIIAIALVSLQFFNGTSYDLSTNGLAIVAGIAFLWSSICRFFNQILTGMTMMFFTGLASLRYFDNQFTMSERAIGFIIGGILLMLCALMFERMYPRKTTSIDASVKAMVGASHHD